MTSVERAVRHRVDTAPVTALLALGDLACIAAFVLIGVTVGHESIDPMAQPGEVLATFLTFAAGWAVTSLLGGLYTVDARASVTRAVAWTVPAWVGAALIAQGIRALPFVPGDAALTFFLVSVGVVLAMLLPWRVAVTVLATGD
ncbi:MAG: DUF3054 domain-containing protein [Halosimplex sp.]